jgi:fructose-bisphosphate aldolase, class II
MMKSRSIINNIEQTLGLFKGCIYSQAPFIIQLSKGARQYADKRMLEAIIHTEATCYDCIESGFYSSVMIDASHEPFEENVAITKRVVERAHERGLSVEAELGRLGGVEEDVQVEEGSAFLTDPKKAVEFVHETGCDSLAAAIGTGYGPYKGKQSLRFEIIRQIQQLLPGTPIVMHGSSSVPEEEVRRINAAGGNLCEAG